MDSFADTSVMSETSLAQDLADLESNIIAKREIKIQLNEEIEEIE